jgi:hypothetical protein
MCPAGGRVLIYKYTSIYCPTTLVGSYARIVLLKRKKGLVLAFEPKSYLQRTCPLLDRGHNVLLLA